MNSAQESKNELEAAIRYAENAISSAKQTIESMEFRQEMAKKQHSEQTGREQALQTQVTLLEERIADMQSEVNALERDLTAKPAQANAWKKEAREAKEGTPTMPVIPKAVAIAIFREGMAYGAGNVCDEIDNAPEVCIEETEYCGGFEVSFTQDIDLCDHLDTDYLRSKAVDNSDEEWVVDCLKNLCADKEFECRIHGVDDEAKDSASA